MFWLLFRLLHLHQYLFHDLAHDEAIVGGWTSDGVAQQPGVGSHDTWRYYCYYWAPVKWRGAWYIISAVSVCLPVSQDDNFRKPWHWKFTLAHRLYLQRIWVGFVYGGQGQGHRSKRVQKSLFPQSKTSIGNNSHSRRHWAMKFACTMGFSDMADWVVGRHLCHVTGSDNV